MKRALIFLAAGPAAVVLVASLALAAGGGSAIIVQYIVGTLFLLTLPVVLLAVAVDAYLARSFPISLRAPVTAIAGAIGAGALAFGLLHCFFPPSELVFLPLGGAVCTGACSLLANDDGRQHSAAPAGP